MNNIYKGKAKYILVPVVLLLFIVITKAGSGKGYSFPHFGKKLTADSIPAGAISPDTGSLKRKGPAINIEGKDTSKPFLDTVIIKTDTISARMSKDSLDAPVVYHADDSMVLDVPNKKIYLYGKETKTTYQDNVLTAPGIEFDQGNNMVKASLKKDSLGKVIAFPTFTQGDFKTVSDTIQFNMKTGKGLTKGTYTQQGEMYVYGEKIKKVSADVFYAYRGRFTTCNLDTPHFAFVSKKIKFINKKMAITGPVHPEFEGVPLPVYLPFGIYPLSQGRHSGILPPTFTSNEQLGLALEGLGYYKVLGDNFDIMVRSNIYSYGGWTLALSPRYYRRYRYQGNVSLETQQFRYNLKGDPDYSVSKTYNFRWSHTADTKSRPGVTFSANLNAGSSKFNELKPNSPNLNFSNQLNSSIQYAKVWKDKPYNISINAHHDQNTISKIINVTLPDVSFNLNTLYPFRRKEPIGKLKWYENLGIALNSNVKSLTFFSDDDSVGRYVNIGRQIQNNFQWGGNHSIPISLSLPQLGPFQISPSIGLTERWYQKKFIRSWDESEQKVDTSYKKGFYVANDVSYGVGISTRIFGMFGFGKRSDIKAIRHELRPSLSVSYKPDMNGKDYYDTQVDATGRKGRFSVYDGSLFGAFGEGKFGGMSFGLDNNLQMKVKNKKDTAADATKKISLLDGLSINGSYNFLADSFQLSNFNLSARTNLFEKINITASATLDPYQENANGDRIKKLVWREKVFTLGRFTGGNISMSTQFQGGDKSKKKKEPAPLGQTYDPNSGMPLDEYQTEAAYISNNPAEFADFTIPWSVNLSYSLTFFRSRKADYSGFTTSTSQNVQWNGTLNLSPKWQIGLNGSYNISGKELGMISVSLARDLHCWQMAINVSPVGRYRFFNISISPKSGILRDLKLNRSRYFNDDL